MNDFWQDIDLEAIKHVDEFWHWNITEMMKGDAVKNARWFDCPMYMRLILIFKDGWVRIDEYSKNDGSNRAGTKHIIVIDENDIRFINSAFKHERKRETWSELLKRMGADISTLHEE